jgi:hypothetical protein
MNLDEITDDQDELAAADAIDQFLYGHGSLTDRFRAAVQVYNRVRWNLASAIREERLLRQRRLNLVSKGGV